MGGAPFEGAAGKMALAIELSRRNVAHGTGGPFGAVVFDIDTNALVAAGVNVVVPQESSPAHAEIMAILLAEKALGTYSLGRLHRRFAIVVNAQPCAMCFSASLWAGIHQVVVGASGEDVENTVGYDEGPMHPDWVAEARDRGVEITLGLMREEAVHVLADYASGGGVVYNGKNVSQRLSMENRAHMAALMNQFAPLVRDAIHGDISLGEIEKLVVTFVQEARSSLALDVESLKVMERRFRNQYLLILSESLHNRIGHGQEPDLPSA